MTTTEEIIVSGKNFIERRIILSLEEEDIKTLRDLAYSSGYKRGLARGFLMGLAIVALAAVCVWLVASI